MFLRRAFAEGRHLTIRLPESSRPLPHRHGSFPSIQYAGGCARRAYSLRRSPLAIELSQDVERFHLAIVQRTEPPHDAFLRLQTCLQSIPQNPEVIDNPSKRLIKDALAQLSRSNDSQDRSVLRNTLHLVAAFLRKSFDDYVLEVFSHIIVRRNGIGLRELLIGAGLVGESESASLLPHWHRLLSVAASRRDTFLLTESFKTMARMNVVPTTETVKIIVGAFFEPLPSATPRTPPSYQTMEHLIGIFSSFKIPYDGSTAQAILEGFTSAGQDSVGEQVKLLYTSALSDPSTDITEEQIDTALARLVVENSNRKLILAQLKRFKKLGIEPSVHTFLTVVGETATLENYTFWRDTMQVAGHPRAAAKVMEHLLQHGSARQALGFYKQESSRGIRSPKLLQLAISALLSRGLSRPSDRDLDEAIALYHDFLPDGTTVEEDERPLAQTYQLLLRSLSRVNAAKRLPTALMLVEDMRRFRVRLDPQSTASLVILLMRSSSSPQEAVELYRLVSRPNAQKDGQALNEEGYNAVLDAFCKLETWPHGVPSTREFFGIVKDMRAQGLQLNAKAYTIIIRHLALLATKVSSAAVAAAAVADEDDSKRELIAQTLTRVHNHLTVNSAFTPDVVLWNQLMDAYQRAGCFPEAYRIWNQLLASGQFDNVSVSIIIDACAFNHAYDIAVRVYTTLTDRGYPMNIRNWNTFLECLCRLGKMDEAMKVLCLEMSGRDDGIAPNKESVRILLKFAARDNQEVEVRSRIKRFLPKLYYSVLEEQTQRGSS